MQTAQHDTLTLKWANRTLAGFSLLAESHPVAAGRNWLEARDLLGENARCHAVAAVAHSNLAAGNVLLHRWADARTAFAQSGEAWRALAKQVDTAELPIATTSSSFHFRLAARDAASFMRLRRRRYTTLCHAGWDITRFNSLQASEEHDAAALEAGRRALRGRLLQTFGMSCVEVGLLSGDDEAAAIARAALYEAKAKAVHLLADAERPPVNFWKRLECAVKLTALLMPSGRSAFMSTQCT
jgi:hypothetical protein